MAYGSPPTSQKAQFRPITVIGPTGECTFNIRPEDLSWTDPVRINATQTLGSAWVDAFGPGIGQIVIAGHTGWSGGHGGGPDWEAQFQQLYDVAYKGWNDAVKEEKDPTSVEMLFVDTLDNRAARVVPKTFVLRRNKARPLLIQYNITFMVVGMVGDDDDQEGEDETSQASFQQGQDSLKESDWYFDGMSSDGSSELSDAPARQLLVT